jgi:hypothetical protein
MPLFKQTLPPTPTPINVDPNDSTASNIGGIYLTDDFTDDLVSQINGTSWNTTFYTQFLGSSDVVTNSNDVTDATLKQYIKINNLDLKVTSALTPSYDAATGTTTVTGIANTYPVMTPLIGDVFLASIQPGVIGVFELTDVTPKTMFKQSIWEITYTQIGYSTPAIVAELDRFVVEILYFNLDKLIKERKPLLTSFEYNLEFTKIDKLIALCDYYYGEFNDPKINTFLYPDFSKIYDVFLVEFFNKVIDGKILGGKPKPLYLDIRGFFNIGDFSTIFDIIVKQNPSMLANCVKTMTVRHPIGRTNMVFSNSLLALNITNLVFPTQVGDVVFKSLSDTSTITPIVYPPYIFTDTFYTTTTASNLLEEQVLKVINKQAINFIDILPFFTEVLTLPKKEQFYKIPILLLLGQMSK